MFSNKYIFLYTAGLVMVVAVVLASAAYLLQPMQERNRQVAKMQEILQAAAWQDVSREEAETVYNQRITCEWMVDTQGQVVSEFKVKKGRWKAVKGGKKALRAFDCDLKMQLSRVEAGEKNVLFPVFVCGDTLYIVPLQGKGLWGPIWGYLAVKADFNTIAGATFDHKGETPGLGAEIAEAAFQQRFAGKKLFDEKDKFVPVVVQKGGADKFVGGAEHAVDAISGGTMTSKGVTDMLADCLHHYEAFFRLRRARAQSAVMPVADSLLVVPATERSGEQGASQAQADATDLE